jgi:hypothetical protein
MIGVAYAVDADGALGVLEKAHPDAARHGGARMRRNWSKVETHARMCLAAGSHYLRFSLRDSPGSNSFVSTKNLPKLAGVYAVGRKFERSMATCSVVSMRRDSGKVEAESSSTYLEGNADEQSVGKYHRRKLERGGWRFGIFYEWRSGQADCGEHVFRCWN